MKPCVEPSVVSVGRHYLARPTAETPIRKSSPIAVVFGEADVKDRAGTHASGLGGFVAAGYALEAEIHTLQFSVPVTADGPNQAVRPREDRLFSALLEEPEGCSKESPFLTR